MHKDLRKYATTELPRYTSYPTAAQFHNGVGEREYRQWLAGIDETDRLSIYVHIPFCHQLCWYCGCHTTIVHDYDRIAAYLKTLHAEIGLLAGAVPANAGVAHIHFGGGTPTLLAPDGFSGFLDALAGHFKFCADVEIAVEADPRTLTGEMAESLAQAGVTRMSLGVQDFTASVQRRINRVQPFDMVAEVVETLRTAGIANLNFDLMYGLPGQSVADAESSAVLAASLRPDRLAVFGYAHVPWFKKHQAVFDADDLPDTAQRFDQACAVAETLKASGYAEIGFDHYALDTDALAKAARMGTFRRNFQGYTDDSTEVLIGLGASSIGTLHQGHVQNAPDLGSYRELVNQEHLPVVRGVALSDEDVLRRDAIEQILCNLELDMGAVCRSHAAAEDALDDALPALRPMRADGLVEVANRHVRVLPAGRRFLRNVAACFDAYRATAETRHSQAV